MNLKRLFLHNWEAKLVCLVLATAIWWALRFYVVPGTEMLRAIPGSREQAPGK